MDRLMDRWMDGWIDRPAAGAQVYVNPLPDEDEKRSEAKRSVHPVSITRFPLTIFSPGAGLLRNPFVHR